MAADLIRWPISIQPHARHRIRERCPGMKPARAVDEVRAALRANRLSANRPDWLAPPGDHQHPITLYAWTEDRVRTYVLHTTANAFVVMSVLTRHKHERKERLLT